MDKVKIEQGVSDIFSAMIANANLKTMEHGIYKHLMDNPKIMTDARHFDHSSGFGDVKDAVELAIQHSVKLDTKVAFLYQTTFMNFSAFKSHVRRFVTMFDGSGCCADKGGTVIGQYLKFLHTGEKADWNPENYWIPSFGTQDQWFEYADGLCHLQHGNPEKYFLAYQHLMIAGQKDGEIAKYAAKQMAEDEANS